MYIRPVLFALLLVVMAACTPAPAATPTPSAPSFQLTSGNVLLTQDFSSPDAWETFEQDGGVVSFAVVDGVYRARGDDRGYLWGLNNQTHTGAVIEVEATQVSTFNENGYGVMCRAADDGSGYYFLISGDGLYTIARSDGGDLVPLMDWTDSGHINQGAARNTIRAACVGDYLALWVNGQFVSETRDSTYTEGFAGLAVLADEGGTVDVAFDNLTITEATVQ